MQTFTHGNSVILLRNGQEFFPALIDVINRATANVYIETYIFADDKSGNAVADALIRAANRRIDVRVVVDGFGSRAYTTAALESRLRDAGVYFIRYREDIFPTFWRHERLRRLHRKLAVIDGRIAFAGGINLIDDMNTPGQTPPRVDFAVRVEGPLLVSIVAAVARFWRVMRLLGEISPLLPLPNMVPQANACGEIKAKFLVRDNLRYRYQIERAYLAALRVAESEVIIANAYFLPGIRFRRALTAAARRGVRVTLILQARVEIRLLRHATKALYGQLMVAGVRIVEFERGFLHAKVAVVDQRWATVGSSNIDPFSLLLAREANVFVRDVDFTRSLHYELVVLEREGGRVVDPAVWSRRHRWARFVDWCAYGLARFLMGLLGVGGRRW